MIKLSDILENFLPFQIITPDKMGVRLHMGRYVETVGPGCHWYIPLFDEITWIAVMPQVTDLADKTMTNCNGDTFSVSGTVEYFVEDAKKALYDVQNYDDALENRIIAIIADAVYKGHTKPEIEDEVMDEIPDIAEKWGLTVTDFKLNEYCKSRVFRIMGVK